MAGLELRDGRYNLIVRFGGKRFIRSLKTSDEDAALSKKLRVEENIRLIESGRLVLPDGADLVTFLLSDGKLNKKPVATASITLSVLFKGYWDALPDGTIEDSTKDMMAIHQRHLERIIGKRTVLHDLQQSDLQNYITTRSKEKTRKGTTIAGITIKKELVTLGSVWKWGVSAGKLHKALPKSDLRYPKAKEPPIFQTRQEIQRQIDSGASDELWDALYLDINEIESLLTHVKGAEALPFVYPMSAMAAYTGARRSELIRSQLSDIDLVGGMITIREKKRVKGTLSTRRVPICDPLNTALTNWFNIHPGTSYTFAHPDPIAHSRRKIRDEENSLTKDQASFHFKKVLVGSEWEIVKGWHCLRHSFISNCASRGIDQRMIDEWVGHTTESMRRRYRHLFPSSQRSALQGLFA